jgi:hypothetical protein
MAIAGSKLGRFVARHWSAPDEEFVRALREAGLVRWLASDMALWMARDRAVREDQALPEGQRPFNSPHERVRVFLGPYLSAKGHAWAVPLDSLGLPDDSPVPALLAWRLLPSFLRRWFVPGGASGPQAEPPSRPPRRGSAQTGRRSN